MKPKPDPLAPLYGENLFNKTIPKDHPFRVLLKEIDWEAIREVLMTDANGEPIEHSTRGRPACDSLVIFKMLFLQRWHPASDRKVEERAFMDISYRFFLKLPFPAPVPDATTLSRYRTLWGDDKIKQVFKNIYRQIQSHGFARVRPGLVGDTTHQHASIQKPTARQLLLDGFVKFINAFVQLGDRYSMFFNQARINELGKVTSTWIQRYNFLCRFEELKKSERFSLLVENILEVQKEVYSLIPDSLPPSVTESESWRAFYRASTLLHQLLDENVGYKSGRSFQKKKGRKIISLVDPDARSGQKSKTNRFTGYKVAVAMTNDRFYPAVETLPGNQSDMVLAIPLVTEAMEISGEIPEAAAFDQGFNSLKNRQELHDLGIQPGIEFEPRINPRNPGFYTVEDFQFDSKTLEVTCPANQTTNRFTLNKKTGKLVFRFDNKCCDTCSKRETCTTSKNGRTVQFSP
ncbi:MAG: transposase, partial [Candidatus Hodarchaeales archaeon]